MNKFKIFLLILGLFVLAGCNNAQDSNTKDRNTELKLFGVTTKRIEKIEIIHNNIIVYPDIEQKDNSIFIEDFNKVLENTDDLLETLDEDLGIDLVDAEAYAENHSENYYVYITFSNQQTLNLKNNDINCDGILFDISNMKMSWSKDGSFVGTVGYTNNTTNGEKEYSTFLNDIKNIFDDLENRA